MNFQRRGPEVGFEEIAVDLLEARFWGLHGGQVSADGRISCTNVPSWTWFCKSAGKLRPR